MFRDRIEAGLRLAEKLRKYQGDQGVVLAVPRGGVPVAYGVAKELGFPLDLILVKKIGHPENKEYAIGAVSLNDEFIIPHPGVSQEYLDEEIDRVRKKLKYLFPKLAEEKELDLKGKTVIVIDDGIATGNTLLMTTRMLKQRGPGHLVVAAPVAALEAVRKLSGEVDEVVTVIIPDIFLGVGAFYEDFEQVTDDEVIYYMERFRKEMKQVG